MKQRIVLPNSGFFRTHTAHSPEEILAAGGVTAFGNKSDKNNEKIIQALEKAAPAEPFSDEEWKELLRQMDDNK